MCIRDSSRVAWSVDEDGTVRHVVGPAIPKAGPDRIVTSRKTLAQLPMVFKDPGFQALCSRTYKHLVQGRAIPEQERTSLKKYLVPYGTVAACGLAAAGAGISQLAAPVTFAAEWGSTWSKDHQHQLGCWVPSQQQSPGSLLFSMKVQNKSDKKLVVLASKSEMFPEKQVLRRHLSLIHI